MPEPVMKAQPATPQPLPEKEPELPMFLKEEPLPEDNVDFQLVIKEEEPPKTHPVFSPETTLDDLLHNEEE